MNKKLLTVFLCLCFWGCLPLFAQGNFAGKYTTLQLLSDTVKLEEFINIFLSGENRFFQDGIAFDSVSGFSYDGAMIDDVTGKQVGLPRQWTAASKEMLKLYLLASALSGNSYAKKVVSFQDTSLAAEKTIHLLEKTILSYESWSMNYPEFGGFIPWLELRTGIHPSTNSNISRFDWSNRVPGLDNGQLAWSLVLVEYVLRQKGYIALADQYRAYWQMLAVNLMPIFYEPGAMQFRAEAKILNTNATVVASSNYTNAVADYFLDDAFEGEMLVIFASLFSPGFTGTDLVDSVWVRKRLFAAEYVTDSNDSITVRQGHWFSSHEMWNWMTLPYKDISLVQRIFLNGEKARSRYSGENNIPGMFASVNPPNGMSLPDTVDYLSACGIPGLGKEEILYSNVITPYAVFPTIIADKAIGCAWLRNTLAGPRMVGALGATEAISTDGRHIATVLTWDAKITTVCALLAETNIELMRSALQQEGVYSTFLSLVGSKYESVFGSTVIKGEDLNLAVPSTETPLAIDDFDTSAAPEVLRGTEFQGDGVFLTNFIETDDSIAINTGGLNSCPGYVWNQIQQTDISVCHWLKIRYCSAGGTCYLEIKNRQDQLITLGKITGAFSATDGYQIKFINLEPLRNKTVDPISAVFAISDANGNPIYIKSISFVSDTVSGNVNAHKMQSVNFPCARQATDNTVEFAIASPGRIRLNIYSISGQLVWRQEWEHLVPGFYRVPIMSASRDKLSSGYYVGCLRGSGMQSFKIVLKK